MNIFRPMISQHAPKLHDCSVCNNTICFAWFLLKQGIYKKQIIQQIIIIPFFQLLREVVVIGRPWNYNCNKTPEWQPQNPISIFSAYFVMYFHPSSNISEFLYLIDIWRIFLNSGTSVTHKKLKNIGKSCEWFDTNLLKSFKNDELYLETFSRLFLQQISYNYGVAFCCTLRAHSWSDLSKQLTEKYMKYIYS